MGPHSLLWRPGVWLLVLVLQRKSIGALNKNLSCISYGAHTLTGGLEHLHGISLEDGRNSTTQCHHNQCCFGIWNLTQRGQLQALVQGCWTMGKEVCDSPACESQPADDSEAAVILSCRCRSDLCNANIKHTGPGKRQAESLPNHTRTIWILAATCSVLLICLAIPVVKQRKKIREMLLRPEETGELTKVSSGPEGNGKRKLPKQELPDLQFLQVLHDGLYSKLWQGTFRQQPVAIKVFAPSCSRQFASEWAVHSLPLMNHDNVIRLMAAGCGGPDKEQGSLLVLTLYPLGSLRHFLTQHVCSWDITIRLGLSLTRGLAFLHQEQWKEGLHKPGVAHRDLSSQNVLVREDKSCVISDFGLAMTLPEHHEQWRGSPMEGVVRKAGAPRYIAPEILDESLDLQNVGSALRQADIYSLALVLWEMLMRCSALFPDNNIPEFQLAYEMELGSNPTHTELRRLAVEERGRPAIPLVWRRIGQVSLYLQELLEDCWDPEPEARLQAECAGQRLQRLGAETW